MVGRYLESRHFECHIKMSSVVYDKLLVVDLFSFPQTLHSPHGFCIGPGFIAEQSFAIMISSRAFTVEFNFSARVEPNICR